MTEKQQERYECAEKQINSVMNVINRVKNGEPESSACRKECVNLNAFRRFIEKTWEPYCGNVVEAKATDWYCWQDALLSDLFGKEVYAYDGFDEIYEEVVSRVCTQKEQEVLRLYYQEHEGCSDIAKLIGLTRERVRVIRAKAIYKLRHPAYSMRLLYGPDYVKAMEERKEAEVGYARRYMQIKESYQRQKNAVVGEIRSETSELRQKTAQAPQEGWADMHLSETGLSPRIVHALYKHHNCLTLSDLANLTKEDIQKTYGLGVQSVQELFLFLNTLGIELAAA